jgi:4-amino-4-deoxy-L-arabinose transferase-like glycosyltransferase
VNEAQNKAPRSKIGALQSREFSVAIAYAVLFGFALYLLFYNLDSHLLWGDEAETALLAKNVLRFGIPKTVDGVNHITVLGNFRDENAGHVWIWAPWLQEYVTAASYLVGGATTWSSRAPFAAMAWLSVVLLARAVYRIYRDHRVALASCLLLATSEVFLLHARQCRYYAITVLAEVVLIYGGFQLLAGKKGMWLLALGLILQFYTNYIVAAANMPFMIALGYLLYRKGRGLKQMVVAVGILAAAAAPWLMYAQPWRQSKELLHENLGFKLLYYLTEWHFHFVPWIFLLLPLAGLLTKLFRSNSRDAFKPVTRFEGALVVGLAGYFGVLLLPPMELRYLLPLLPIGCLLGAAWAFRYIRWPIAAVAVIAIQATSNLFAVASTFGPAHQHAWRAPLIEYIAGLSASYRNRFADVLDALSRKAQAGETVWVADPELPLMFYTGMKIIDARLEVPTALPDWILPESASGVVAQPPLQVPDSVKSSYETIILSVHDSDRLDSIPEPDVYQYRTTSQRADFLIYKKRGTTADSGQ